MFHLRWTSLEEFPMYYMENPWGQIKPVYQATALAARGQNINMVARGPPLQCFICDGPHCAAECPNRMPRDATPMQPSQVGLSTMSILTCNHCGIDHLIAQCPHNPNAPKITPLNLLEVTNEMQPPIPHVAPINVVTRSMLQKKNYIFKERDSTSIAQAKKKKTRQKRSQKFATSNPISKTNIGTGDDPVYLNDFKDDFDSIETLETKTTTVRGKSNGEDHDRELKTSLPPQVIQRKSSRLANLNKIPSKHPPRPTPKVFKKKLEEIEQAKHIRNLVEETQQKLEPPPSQIRITETIFPTLSQPHRDHKPLAIPSIIQEKSEVKASESWHTPFLFERMFIEDLPKPIEEMQSPSSPNPRRETNDQKEPLNIAKLMDFMASEVRTTIMSKLFGDPELFLALRAFLNGELKVGLPPFAQMDRCDTTQNEEEEWVQHLNLNESLVVEIPINKLEQYFEELSSVQATEAHRQFGVAALSFSARGRAFSRVIIFGGSHVGDTRCFWA
ncbi:hypothetical protein L7F22_059438 [Adiantum nelumboides]|nr:hypothetical protein [Adiantum nelumboides]